MVMKKHIHFLIQENSKTVATFPYGWIVFVLAFTSLYKAISTSYLASSLRRWGKHHTNVLNIDKAGCHINASNH